MNERMTAPSGTGTSISASCCRVPGFASETSIVVVATCCRMRMNGGHSLILYELGLSGRTCRVSIGTDGMMSVGSSRVKSVTELPFAGLILLVTPDQAATVQYTIIVREKANWP